MKKQQHKFYVPVKNVTRKDKFKDLMRNRTTVEQGLTLQQIFCEVYSDLMEEYYNKQKENPSKGYYYNLKTDGRLISYMTYYYGQFVYLKRMIKKLRKTDDAFRWLSVVPVKRNEVDPATGQKVRPYLEYRYVNIKASQTAELLERVNAIWSKQAVSTLKTLKKRNELLEYLSTPEGEAAFERDRKAILEENEEIQRRATMTREGRQKDEIERNRASSKVIPMKPEDLEAHKTLDSFNEDDDVPEGMYEEKEGSL